MEVPFPYIANVIGFSAVATPFGAPSPSTIITHRDHELAIQNGQIVERIHEGSAMRFGASRGIQPIGISSLVSYKNILYAFVGTQAYAISLNFQPGVTQSSMVWTHPGQITLPSPTQETIGLLNRGTGLWEANLNFGLVSTRDRDVANIIRSFFNRLDQQAGWTFVPILEPAATGLGAGVATTDSNTRTDGLIEHTLAASISVEPNEWVTDGRRAYYIIEALGTQITLYPTKALANGTTLYPGHTVRARSSTNRPVVNRRSQNGFGGWVWGWREYVQA